MHAGRTLAIVALALAAIAPSPGEAAEEVRAPVRGVVRAVRQATISTDLQVRVSRVAFREGQGFRQGDVLVAFDCRRQRAELAAAEAQQQEMQLSVDNNLILQRSNAVGRHDLEVSRARARRATAEADVHRARLDQCELIAPFDGRVTELSINEHETPQPGRPFIGIIAEGALEIDLVLPSDWLRWIRIGADFRFKVDETATTHTAVVSRLGASVDPVSQTVRAVAVFADQDATILHGMSGSAEFQRGGQ